MTEVMMNRLSWVDYRKRVQDDRAVVLLPVGATEQHGPHLPLGTDHLLATAVSADVAAQVSGLVAPALAYGFKSQPKCGGGQEFCGTTSMAGKPRCFATHRHGHHHRGVRELDAALGSRPRVCLLHGSGRLRFGVRRPPRSGATHDRSGRRRVRHGSGECRGARGDVREIT